MQTIVDFLASIIKWIEAFFTGAIEIIKQALLWAGSMFIQLVQTCLHMLWDSALSLVSWLYHLIDFNESLFDLSLAWGGMPAQAIYVFNEVGLPHCFVMLSAALVIRLTLNLIPGAITRI